MGPRWGRASEEKWARGLIRTHSGVKLRFYVQCRRRVELCEKCAPGGGPLHTPYISCEKLLVRWTATRHTVLLERSYGSHFTRKHTTTEPYSAVAPYQHWGCRGMLGISPEGYPRFGPLLLRQWPVLSPMKWRDEHLRAPL